jgi:hypothetical protein
LHGAGIGTEVNMKKMMRFPTWWAEARQRLEQSGRLRAELLAEEICLGLTDSGAQAARAVERVWRVRRSQWPWGVQL